MAVNCLLPHKINIVTAIVQQKMDCKPRTEGGGVDETFTKQHLFLCRFPITQNQTVFLITSRETARTALH